MLKSLFTKWNILTITAVIAFATTVTAASSLPMMEQIGIKSNIAEYVLKDETGKILSNVSMQIVNSDLIDNEYSKKITLTKISTEDAYLRVFVNVSKQKDNKVYSLDVYNNSNIPYTVEMQNFTSGETLASKYDMEEETALEVNFGWKYYNQIVKKNDVEIFNKITFDEGIEENEKYVVKIVVEMVSVDEFNVLEQWKDKPATWMNTIK